MTRELKERLEIAINRLWDRIDEVDSRRIALAGIGNDADFWELQNKSDKLCSEYKGIKYCVREMGYEVIYDPKTKKRKIVTDKQYLRIVGWDKF